MPKHDDGNSGREGASDATRPSKPDGRQRVAKMMARAGLCSRRDAETWITDGRVALNGAVLASPAVDVGPDDVVLVDGLPLPAAEHTRLFLFHKPRGLVTSDHDPEGRRTIFDHLAEAWPEGPRVVTVGRLDINTEGLLLLTNDGGLARVLELPQTGWVRRYRVRAKGVTDQGALDGLREGVTIEGVDYAGIEARFDRVQGSNCWLTMGLREGKNREVKRVLEHVGLEVNRLIRLSFGPFQLGDLPDGAVSEVKTRILRDQLGAALAAQAGVDFHEDDAAVPAPVGEMKPRASGPKGAAGASARAPRPAPPARASRAPSRATHPPASSFKPKGHRGRDDSRSDRRDEEAPPVQRERPAGGPRKHVSLLRAAPGSDGPRKRVERTSTRDSADRAVAVERVGLARPAPTRAAAGKSGSGKSGSGRSGARSRAPDPGRTDDARGPRRDGPAQRSAGASPAALGKRERVLRSGGPRREAGARRDAPEREPGHGRGEAGRPRGRDAAPDGRRREGAASRSGEGGRTGAPRGRPAGAGDDRAMADKPPSGRPRAFARPDPRGRPPGELLKGERPRGEQVRGEQARGEQARGEQARGERQARPPRPRGTRDGAARRGGDGPRDGKAPGGGRRETSGDRPRGRPVSGKFGGGKSGAGKPSGGKPGGGRPAGRPKR